MGPSPVPVSGGLKIFSLAKEAEVAGPTTFRPGAEAS